MELLHALMRNSRRTTIWELNTYQTLVRHHGMLELLVFGSLRAPTPFHTVYLSQRIASVVTEAIVSVIPSSNTSHARCHASVDIVSACRFRYVCPRIAEYVTSSIL